MIVSAFLTLTGETTLNQIVDAARSLEAAGVTAVGTLDATATDVGAAPFESTTLAGRLAVTTSTIGVVASNSALYGFPYHSARRLATIDHLSGGRSGWLMRTRTAPSEVTAYDWRSLAGRGEELHRAVEYAEISLELWDCWEEGAQRPDKATGDFKDDSRIHPINYRSTSFRVAGPFDVPPSPQRRSVLFVEIATAEEAVLLAPYADVAIVVADSASAVAPIADLISATSSSTLVLVAGALGGVSAAMPASEALEVPGVAGVALYLDPTEVGEARDLLAGRGLEELASPTTLAAALGIESTFTHGGHAA
ncbi:hypothetical protein BH10ACT3_BH10ACT3_06520 [soil metagenome]